jgi:murein DD-endopeptidase MepM/ murein hydrolase activator NlpD
MSTEQESVETASSKSKPTGFGTWPVPGSYSPTVGGGLPEFGTPRTNKSKIHNGVDIACPIGSPLVAWTSGKVLDVVPASQGGSAGAYVMLEHTGDDGKKFYTMYQHLNDFKMADGRVLKPGMEVKEGEQIGHTGDSGNARRAAGPQLHFEVRYSEEYGKTLNPSEIGFMQKGAFGPKVKELNEGLASQGYDVDPKSDKYNAKTEAAVKQWQTDHGYPLTGVVDGNLREAMLHPDRYVSTDRSVNSLAASDNPANGYYAKIVEGVDKLLSEGRVKLPEGVTSADVAAQMMGDAVKQKLGVPDFTNPDAVSVKPSQDGTTVMLSQGQMPVAITKLTDVSPGKIQDNAQTIDTHISNQKDTQVSPPLAQAPSMLKVA